jgi:hypothetical protein
MADDVLMNAVPQQPAPNINNDTTKTIKEQGIHKEDNKMDEDTETNKNLIINNSYVNPSTMSNVATNTNRIAATATATQPSNYQNECPETPYTSNTTNDKYNASSTSYLIKTPPTSNTDMAIDEPMSPQTYTIRSTPGRRSFKKKDSPTPLLSSPVNPLPMKQQNSPSTKVPPIRPFLLGQAINVSSLASAVQAVQNEVTDGDALTAQDLEQYESKSETSMDTSDVSTLLKPKSIFNPYSKQKRITANMSITNDAKNNSASIDQRNPVTTTNITHTSVLDRTPLIPIDATDSTKPNETNVTEQTQETQINELSQEEEEFISNELAKHEQQNKWLPVASKKSSSRITKPADNKTPVDNNPYSPLQDEDTDSDSTSNTKAIHNNSKSTSNITSTPTETTAVRSRTKNSPSISPTQVRGPKPDRRTTQSSRSRSSTNPGRGGGCTRHSDTTPTNRDYRSH